jgi:hypothetical protein
MPDFPSGTVTFLFTDIEGSARLWEAAPGGDERGPGPPRRPPAQGHPDLWGRVFKAMGDPFCAAFATAPDAIAATLEAQHALNDKLWGETVPLRVRSAVARGSGQPRPGGRRFVLIGKPAPSDHRISIPYFSLSSSAPNRHNPGMSRVVSRVIQSPFPLLPSQKCSNCGAPSPLGQVCDAGTSAAASCTRGRRENRGATPGPCSGTPFGALPGRPAEP